MTDTLERQADEAAIAAMLEAWGDAIGGKRVTDAESHMTPDVLQYSLAPPLRSVGRDAEGLEAWFATWEGPIGGEVRDVRLTLGGNVAFWTGLVHMTGTKTDGVRVDLWFRETLGLRKIDGAWKIAHIHESVPFAMDGSGRAELGLKP
jgi:ketosteroid isomerase-like protein